MCFKIIKDVALKHKIVRKIGIIVCDNSSFRKEQGDSLRGIEYLFKKHKEYKTR